MGVHLYTNGAWTDSGRIYRNSLNLFDISNAQVGYHYTTEGEIEAFTNNYAISGYIPVTVGQAYIRCYDNRAIGNRLFAYNSNKLFINWYEPGSGQPFTVPEGIAYITFNIPIESYPLNAYMVIQGTTPKPYEPYNVVDWYTNTGHGYSSGAWN